MNLLPMGEFITRQLPPIESLRLYLCRGSRLPTLVYLDPFPVVKIRDMSNAREKPWSDDPNALEIQYRGIAEKANCAGMFLGAISYGAQTYSSIYPCSSCLSN